MTTQTVIGEQFAQERNALRTILERLLTLADETGHTPLVETVTDLLERIREPFLFVIVGEVKSGKSSFINALLDTGRDICAVAPSPMTDTIQQITYGEKEHTEVINPYLKRVTIPEPVLKEIAIVDTPGTNTIIAHHQEITERFIPGADLIVFVFEAKNPYRQSAWDFFAFIHDDWKKRIMFILQQKDLLPAADLAVNERGVEQLAKERGITKPLIFSVSALQEQEGQKAESGFGPLRTYLRNHITGGNAPLLKLKSISGTASNIAEQIAAAIALREAQYKADVEFREDIRKSLDQQAHTSQKHVSLLVESLANDYDRITREKAHELAGVLSFTSVVGRSLRSIFSKKSSMKEWLQEFFKGLDDALAAGLRDKMNDRVIDLAESIQQMGQIVDLKIRSSKTILANNSEIFSDIAARRARVLSDLRDAFKTFLSKAENFTDPGLMSGNEKIAPRVVTGSGITVVGVVIAALTNGAVFDITGGILTTIGVVFTGVTLGIQRRRILKRYREEMASGRQKLIEEVTERLEQYVRDIRVRIEHNFTEFDRLLGDEKEQLHRITEEHQNILHALTEVTRKLPKG